MLVLLYFSYFTYLHFICVAYGHDDDTLICYYHKFENGKLTAAHKFLILARLIFFSADNPLIRLVLINDKVKLGWNHYELANHEHIYIFVSNYITYPLRTFWSKSYYNPLVFVQNFTLIIITFRLQPRKRYMRKLLYCYISSHREHSILIQCWLEANMPNSDYCQQ